MRERRLAQQGTGTRVLALVALTVVLILAAALAIKRAAAPSETVYSVRQVALGLGRQPAAWVGRSVLVRGIAISITGSACPTAYPGCKGTIISDSPSPTSNGTSVLTINQQTLTTNALWTAVRRVPLVGHALADRLHPANVPWGDMATYRVEFYANPYGVCTLPCLGARLVDIAG